MPLKSHWWWDHSTKDFSEMDMSEFVAILPVAAVEQHGPHLPVRVDSAINAGIIARAVEIMPDDMKVMVLPMQAVGKSVEHLEYPGTLTLSYETLARLWFEIGESVARAGCKKIIFANSHGGQPQVMEIVCRELRIKCGMFAVSSWVSAGASQSDLYSEHELKHGIHGGESETSTMLHLHPDLVDMQYAEDFQPMSVQMENDNQVLTAEGRIGFGWQTQDLHPSGACGNAAAADAERGATHVQRSAESLVALCQEVLAFPMERLTQKTMFKG
ncbi:creatininase family protein [Martelella alba]|uniref:Creatininase family protein n=1 Tax=Martelella alba TaxID=2590451 RepID=A0A506UAE8_9HYPH|nr:creatininase family protein [Martelella alba]TPW30498.1 creatininase family protein [Martelella alba]